MKQFFEEYGGVALGILAVLVLIAMVSPIGEAIKTSLTGVTSTFAEKMNNGIGTATKAVDGTITNAASADATNTNAAGADA